MHSELALNRCKLVSALIEMSLKLQISMRNESLFWTKLLPYFIKPSQVTIGTILEGTFTCSSQDKSSSNTPLGTHSHDVLVENYHTQSHHPTHGTGAALLGLCRKE